jgi:4-hydroxy-tetrahydrodipicolinate synthase
MAHKLLTGSFVALMTPFNEDYSVDWEGFRTLLDFQAAHGTSAVLIMGSTGEASMLAPDEKKEIISKTLAMRTGKMELWYGCTGAHTDATLSTVRHASDEGADGIIVTIPSYVVPPEADSIDYFIEVADAATVPVGVYNNPTRVKTDLSAEAMIKIASHENIMLLKEATSRGNQIAQIARAGQHLSIMCCDSPNLGLVMHVMSLGGHGTANMGGNIIPAEMATISVPWKDFAQVEAFRETYLRVLPLLHFHYSAINPVAVKALARALGLPAGPFRRPLKGLEGAALAKGVEIVRELGIAGQYGYTLDATNKVTTIGVQRAAAE